jgi:general secretion pathway protein A
MTLIGSSAVATRRLHQRQQGLGTMYNSYFGFVESPFTVTPDPHFSYRNSVYQEAYANLRYGVEGKKGFVVITGEAGTGKTTLLRKLMRNLGDSIHSAFVFNSYLSFPELVQLILHDLGLVPKESSKVAMLQELNEYLITGLKQGHIVAVLIDEAQSLTDEALEGLRLLSNLETDQEKLLQIVLMGQPELQAKLDQPKLRQLKQRVALQCRLTPLKEAEVGSYIDFRLRAAGYQGKGLFHRQAVQQVASCSKGIPRLINIICDNALLNAYARSQKSVSADVIMEVARDLRLEPERQVINARTIPLITPVAGRPSLIHQVSNKRRRQKVRRMTRAAGAILVITGLFVALASIIDPANFLSVAEKRLKGAQHNLGQWVALVTHQEVVPEKVNTEVESKSKEQRVIIQYRSTIYEIASDTYGANIDLGMDLIKEFNPQIRDLSRILPGQDLLLPPLTAQTMVRAQPDGTYRLIATSFRSITRADESARLLRDKGYEVLITPKQVSKNLVLHRVEIVGLKDIEEAKRTWVSDLSYH